MRRAKSSSTRPTLSFCVSLELALSDVDTSHLPDSTVDRLIDHGQACRILSLKQCTHFLHRSLTFATSSTGLPDAASIEAASWVENDNTVLIDASTAFRVNEDWVYGFPELSPDQTEALKKSKRIANPGCYPTGFIGLTRPLTDAGILPKGTPLTVNAISGYSGGGKALMNLYEHEKHEPWGAYGLSL